MPGLGNPLSLPLGGGPSPQEVVYDALRQAVGDGIRAKAGTIVEAWRMARARGLAAAMVDDRAALQAFPNLATDFLETYEDILRIAPPADASDNERRETVTTRYTRAIDASFPKLEAQLQAIDSAFSIVIMSSDLTRITDVGLRAFEDWNPASPLACGPAFDIQGRDHTRFPNFSDDFILHVLFDIGGSISLANQRLTLRAEQELNESLPAWVDFRIFTAIGFILDQDLLDVTAFGDGVL